MTDLLDGVLEALRLRRIALDAERARLDRAIAAIEALPPAPNSTSAPSRVRTAKPKRTRAKPAKARPSDVTGMSGRERLILQTVIAAGPAGIAADAIGAALPSLSRHGVTTGIRRLTSTGQIQKRGATRSMRYYAA